jgi:hypothetical protein
MAPPSDIRDRDRRGELKSPCTDEGRPSELVDRDSDGPIGGRTRRTTIKNVMSTQRRSNF